ncbi:MAG: cation diffusion facilitator family transporter [Alphaproteobacteria bacterium]|nr:cation diffusion facilitator family transporter [Alphaproteobacteria bacterium]
MMDAAAARPEPERTARLLRRASHASVAVAGSLILVKAGAYFLTDSVSVLSSLLDSLLDLAASVLNVIAIRHALAPADYEHRFGHGKAEPLAGLGQAAFIAGSAGLLFVEASRRLMAPHAVANVDVGVAVMAISMVASLCLVIFQRRVVRLTGSVAVGADSLHYQSDLLLNGAVIAALLLGNAFHAPWLDPVFGMAIAAFILWSAWQIVHLSVTHLMDRELPDRERERIRAIALDHPEVRSVHDLRTRAAGPQAFIQIHIELDPDMSLRRAHVVSDAVEAAITTAFPHAEVIIHQDPEGIQEVRLAAK